MDILDDLLRDHFTRETTGVMASSTLVEHAGVLEHRAHRRARRTAIIGFTVGVIAAAGVAVAIRSERLSVIEVNPATTTPAPAPVIGPALTIDGQAVEVATGAGAVWTITKNNGHDTLLHVDAATGLVAGQVAGFTAWSDGIAVSRDAAWLLDGTPDHGGLLRIDPATNTVTGRLDVIHPIAVAAGGDRVWVVSRSGPAADVLSIDPVALTVLQTSRLPSGPVIAAIVSSTSLRVVVGARDHATIETISGRTGRVAHTASVEGRVRDAAWSRSSVWVAGTAGVFRIDGATGRLERMSKVSAERITTSGGHVWFTVTVEGGRLLHRLDSDDIRILPSGSDIAADHNWVWVAADDHLLAFGPA